MWIFIGEYSFFVYEGKSKKDLKKILKEFEGRESIEAVELRHEWKGSLENLEEYILKNSEVLLKYPFFSNKVKQNNTTIQDYIANYLKRVREMAKGIADKVRVTVRVEKPKDGVLIETYKGEPTKLTEEGIKHLTNLIIYRELLISYNLIQEKIKEEIKGTPKIKSIETIPGNSLFINFQNINKEVIKNSKTKLIFNPPEKLTVFQKATLLSLYYAILSCIKEGKNQVSPNMFSFTLTNLMEVVGIPKRDWGDVKRGYSHEKKEEVLWLLTNVINKPLLSISVKSIDTETQKELKELLKDFNKDFNEESDFLYFNPFGVIYNVLTTKEKDKIVIKDAIIKIFIDNSINVEAIKTFKTKVFRSKLDDPHYRLLAIWLDTGSRLGEKVKTTPQDLLKIAEIEIDYRHPERVKKKLGSMLARAKGEEIIKDYEIEKYSRRNFKDWLESKCIIFFSQKGGDKKK